MQPEVRAQAVRWAKRFGKGLLIVVGVVVALGGVALGVLGTSFGGERVRGFVLPRINQAIAGHLEVGALRTHLTGIELSDVTLSDPEGHVVAKVARIDVVGVLRKVLSDQIEISHVEIDRPRLWLVQSPRGLNLARAIAPREPAPPEPEPEDTAPAQLQLILRRLAITEGLVHFRDTQPGGAAPVQVEQLDVKGDGTFALARQSFDGRITIGARTLAPLAAPLSLRLEGTGSGADAKGQANVRLDWGDARVHLEVASKDARSQSVSVEQIAVPPALVRAFAPEAPVRATLSTRGKIDRRGDRIDVALALRAGDAEGDLRAGVDLAQQRADPVHLALTGIDLAQLIVGGPPSRFDLVVEGQGGGQDLQTAKGQLELNIPPGKLDGRKFGPVRIDVATARGQHVLRALELALPGLTVTARGEGSVARLQAEAKVVAADLALTARSLRLPPTLAMAGHGQLALRLGGRPAAPTLSATGQFPRFRIAGNELTGLSLTAGVADLRAAPAGTNVRVKLVRARLGTQTVRDFDLAVVSRGNDAFSASLTTAAPLPLSLTAAGRSSGRGEILDLESLVLTYPEATWRLVQPVRLRAADGDIALGSLALQAAPDQRIEVDLSRRGNRITAHAGLVRFDLGRLPALVQPPGNRLAGLVDAGVQITGRMPRPDAKIDLRLGGGSVGKVKNLALALQAQHRAGRIDGKLDATALGSNHAVQFDLPVTWPPPPSARLQLKAAVGEIDLAQLAALAKTTGVTAPPAGSVVQGAATTPPAPVQGRLIATLEIEGPAGDPALSLHATASKVQLAGVGAHRVDEIVAVVRDPIGKPLQVDVQTKILGRKSSVSLESPVVIGPWLRRPPSNDALLAIPFRARADVDRLPLASFGGSTAGKPDFAGVVSAHAVLVGPARALHGSLTVDADEVRGPGLPATSARLQARLGEGGEGLDAKLTVTRQARPIAVLTAALGAGLDDLLAGRSLAKAKVQIKGHVGPLVLQRLVAGAETGRKDRRPVRADVEADLNASGTLGDPKLELRLAVQDARLSNRPLGSARLHLVYGDAKPALNAQISSAGGGKLTVGATAKVDLSLPAVMRGINSAQIPVDVTVAARALDLAFLSGVHDDVRNVEGRLEADARVTGKAGAPQMAGKVSWRGGRLVLAGFGDMRDIELGAHGDQREMVLDRLFARSGSGTATISGRTVRSADGHSMALDASADVSRFRVQSEGQPLGDLSLNARAKGTIAPERIEIGTTISEARMELADGDRRDLQSLKRPDDVVLLVNGEPLDRAQARRYEKLVTRAPAPPTTVQTTPTTPPPTKPVPKAPEEKIAAAVAGQPTPQPPPAPPPPPAAPREGSREVRINVDAPRNLWVRGADVNIEVGLEPGFTIRQADETRIFGTITVKRGFVEALSRRFDVNPGSTVRFTGDPARPTLSIDATYKLKGEEITSVVVHIEGSADKFAFTLRSPEHPEYGDTELLSLIATGRLPSDQGKGGATADSKAKSLVGNLLASRVQKVLTAHLPIDVLSIQPGDEVSGTRLEAGTYLRDDVYVAYVGRVGGTDDPLGRENRNEVHLEYQLNPRWSFEATYGDARRGSVDLLWTRNY